MLLRTARYSLFLFLLFTAKTVCGLSTDARLLQLVPPRSHLVAGMSRAAAQGTTGSFLVITRENKTDLKDFFALVGGDASHRLNGLVFVTGAERNTDGNEHSLLVSGKFDREAIFRLAGSAARRETYRGTPVLQVPPFERERQIIRETRWLAILDGQIAIFGSVESVRTELDRWMDQSEPDRVLMDQYRRLEKNDDTWSLLLALDRRRVAESVLEKLDSKLGAAARGAQLLACGIKFGRRITIVVAADSFKAEDRGSPEDLELAARAAAMYSFSFLPRGGASLTREGASSRAEVKVSRQRYERWIEESAPRDPLLSGSGRY